jgi:hypothetical protein
MAEEGAQHGKSDCEGWDFFHSDFWLTDYDGVQGNS